MYNIQRVFLLLALVAALPGLGRAQNCSTYFPFSKGATFELTNYNAKDKVTGRVAYEILDMKNIGGFTEATVRATIYDEKNKAMDPMEYAVRCKDGALAIDMRSFIPAEQMKGDMQFEGEASFLEVPSALEAGATLPDGSFEGEMSSGDAKSIMTMRVAMTNRKVEAKENMTTPAGTFEAYKLSSDMEVGTRAMGIKLPSMKAHTVEWYAKDAGVVRSETWRKDKLVAYSQLTKLQK